MMLHSLPPEARQSFKESSVYKTTADIAESLDALLEQFRQGDVTLPVVAYTRVVSPELDKYFGDDITVDRRDGATFFWGRIPLRSLIAYFLNFNAVGAHEEVVDLGTPVKALMSRSANGQTCAQLLPLTAPPPSPHHGGTAKVSVAVVDLGKSGAGPPDSYGGHLRHAVAGAVEMDPHAEDVLAALLERLQGTGRLSDVTVHCALVEPPGSMIIIGKTCFEQACAPEMLASVQKLIPQLAADGLPAVINMSLGTHVGPHTGDSPLESFLTGLLVPNSTFLVAAAGNDGGLGHAIKRSIAANEDELINIQSGANSEDLLVELWWKDATHSRLSIQLDVWELQPNGSNRKAAVLSLAAGTAGAVLGGGIGAGGSATLTSLFSAKVRNSFSCAAFAISGLRNAPLPALQIRIRLSSTSDTIVNGWIVLPERGERTLFVEGGQQGSVNVPACAPGVIGVAGVDAHGQVWENSARGPAAQYEATTPGTQSPTMAHLAGHPTGSASGTSFSSPRATADMVKALVDPLKLARCSDGNALIQEAYGLSGLSGWSERTGYHKQTT